MLVRLGADPGGAEAEWCWAGVSPTGEQSSWKTPQIMHARSPTATRTAAIERASPVAPGTGARVTRGAGSHATLALPSCHRRTLRGRVVPGGMLGWCVAPILFH
jgi:hypothetical protein